MNYFKNLTPNEFHKSDESILYVEYDGYEIASSNYFKTCLNKNGTFYLEYNRKCFYLFVPTKHVSTISEMITCSYAVFTTGKHRNNNIPMLEMMFEDFSDSPFRIDISETIMTGMDKAFNNKIFPLKVYSESGKIHEMKVYVRSDKSYTLPHLKPININSFSDVA